MGATGTRCDHSDICTIPRHQFARLIEGECPDCEVPLERTDEGFARCSCCRMELLIEGDIATCRVPFVVVEDDDSPVSFASTERTVLDR